MNLSHLDKLFRGRESTIPTLTAREREVLKTQVEMIRNETDVKKKKERLLLMMSRRLNENIEPK
jgi:hypothetical protein